VQHFCQLCEQAYGDSMHRSRITRLLMSQLVCLGRHSITGLISTAGRQFRDWSADYRLFSQARFNPESGFATVRKTILKHLPEDQPLIVGIDDTHVRKAGTKTHGVKWRRDPLSPPFHVNFIRAQRYVQISAALPQADSTIRMLPVDLVHAPTRPNTEDPSVTEIARDRLQHLRQQLDNEDPERLLWIVADGGFSNKTVMRDLPDRSVFIGRVRKDAKFHYPPVNPQTKGRRRVYGEDAPRPQELAKDESVPWETCYVNLKGKRVRFRYKTITNLLSRKAGPQHNLRLIVLAPRHYKLRKKGRFLYKSAAHLICTDSSIPVREILQAYLYRWDLEVNFREEKAILGMEEALVRTEASTQRQPAAVAIAYAFLHLAHNVALGEQLKPPKWRTSTTASKRPSTNQLIQNLRQQLWFESLETFSDFVTPRKEDTKSEKVVLPLESAVLYVISA
jgi:hypothetical protein